MGECPVLLGYLYLKRENSGESDNMSVPISLDVDQLPVAMRGPEGLLCF